jgi:hypothetical protein
MCQFVFPVRLGMLSVTVVAYRRSSGFCLEKAVKISVNQAAISMNSQGG